VIFQVPMIGWSRRSCVAPAVTPVAISISNIAASLA
jgi:hypothetical protein